MDSVTLGVIAYVAGVIFSTVYPYLTVYLQTGESFDYRYTISRVIAALIVAVTAIIVPGFTEWLRQTALAYDYPTLFVASVFMIAYGTASLGRETEKLTEQIAKSGT